MTYSISQEDLRTMISQWLPADKVPTRFRVLTDTTDFFKVDYDDVVLLGEKAYLIRHNAKELRFGLEDEIKYWVKRAVELKNGELKIIKLVFFEKFTTKIGEIEFECFRSPRKEARVLEIVSGHRNFMHGHSVEDEKGNTVRILNFIKGKPLSSYVPGLKVPHEEYFHEIFPDILDHYIEAVQAIAYLHERGEKHGDIRRDHILIDAESGVYRWIDFDFNYRHRENIYGYDLFGLGNILLFIVGRGDVLLREMKKQDHPALDSLTEQDLNIVFRNRVVNLQKVFPYIPDFMNQLLLHFSKGASRFYEDTFQFLEDLKAVRQELSFLKKSSDKTVK